MTTKRFLSFCLFLLLGAVSENVWAQTALNAIMTKCESMDNVDIQKIVNKDSETRKVIQIVTDVTFQENQALVDEIVAAFNKDKEETIQQIDSKKNGRMLPEYYIFDDGEKGVAFSFGISKAGRVNFTKIEDYRPKNIRKALVSPSWGG